MTKQTLQIVMALGLVATTLTAAKASGIKYTNEDGDYVKLGGRIQLQYHMVDPDGGGDYDELFFRRIRPYIEGSVHENWKGKIQWDMGKGELGLRDAYMAYTGWDGVELLIGNYFVPFGRESLASSKKQQLVERTFTGDHNYGVCDRQAGIHLVGEVGDMLTWAASAAKAAHDPDNKKLDFDSVVADKGDDWSEGEMLGARVDFHPFGIMTFDQGCFKPDEFQCTIGAAAFTYSYDGDVPGEVHEVGSKDILDTAGGYEISGGLRGFGFSADVGYNIIDAELEAPGVTAGLYKDSQTTLDVMSVEGGFMLVPKTLEVVAGYQSLDADNYEDAWVRKSVGLNWFLAKQDIKYQLTYRMGENKDGKNGSDVDEVFVQAQYVF